MLDDGECSEALHFQFVSPVGIIEWSGPLQERHWLENLHGNVNSIPKWDELLCSRQVGLNPIIVVCRSLETNFVGSSNEGNRSSFTLQRIGTLASRDRSTIPAHRCRVAGRRSRPGRSRPGRSSQAGGCDLRLAPVILRCAPSPSSSSWLFGGLGPIMQNIHRTPSNC